MDRMKTLLKYAIWIILFIIISEILIQVGLNANYSEIERKDNISQIQIYQQEATLVNGRIKGMINTEEIEDYEKKYLKIDFYSNKDKCVGTKYVDLVELGKGKQQGLELYFKVDKVKSYSCSITDTKENIKEIKILPKDLNKGEILLGTLIVLMII